MRVNQLEGPQAFWRVQLVPDKLVSQWLEDPGDPYGDSEDDPVFQRLVEGMANVDSEVR